MPYAIWLIGLFLLGLAPRLVLLGANADNLQFYEYETLAQNIVDGNGYVIQRFGHLAFAFGDGNLYSFVAASVYFLVGHQPVVLGLIQAVIGSFVAPVVFVIGRQAFEHKVAVLGGALAALHPGMLAYTLKLHPLGMDVLLMALIVMWMGRPLKKRGNLVGTGLALGLALMSRPTFFLAGGAALALRAFFARSGPRVLVPFLIALLVVAPWIVRNTVVLGRPVFISTSLEDVWKGNNPFASGSSYLPSGNDIFSTASSDLRRRFYQTSELDLNDVFASEIVGFVSHQPTDFLGLTARKFGYFWSFSPQSGLLYPLPWLTAYQLYFGVVTLFAVVGIGAILFSRSAQQRRLLGTLAVITVTLAAIHALSYVEGRHRWGVEPLLLLLTARGAVAGFYVIGAIVLHGPITRWSGGPRIRETLDHL